MNREQACNYLRSSGFSDEQIKAIEGAFACEDAVSALNRVMEYTYGMLTAEKAGLQHLIKSMLDDLPSVNPQPCEDAISRQAVLDCFKRWQPYMATRLWCFEQELTALPSVKPKSECEHDHEILKAYSDGANEVLAIIRAEIDEEYDRVHPYDISCAEGLEMALNIVDKYMTEEGKE